MKRIKESVQITDKKLLAENIYRMTFETFQCKDARPGQFVMVYPPDKTMLLGRPICIADAYPGSFDIVFRTSGKGTRKIADCKIGDQLETGGPFGNGYPFDDEITNGKKIVLLGGGIGAPSLLFLARRLKENKQNVTAVLGYRNKDLKHFLAEDFKKLDINTYIATDDGSEGIHGNVIDVLNQEKISSDLIYACGPMPMLSAVKAYSKENHTETFISLEEHMACGAGVCLGCVVKTVNRDAHSHVNNARICTEGPVFAASEVDI